MREQRVSPSRRRQAAESKKPAPPEGRYGQGERERPGSKAGLGSERRHRIERPCQPPHGLRLGRRAPAARLHAGIRHQGGADHAARLQRARVHGAREAQHVHVLGHADLLLARDHEVAIGQHVHDRGGDGAGEGIGTLQVALAFEVVGAVAAELQLAEVARADEGERAHAGRVGGRAVHLGAGLLRCGDRLHDLDGDDVAHQPRAAVLERRPVAGRMEEAAGGRPGRAGHRLHGDRRLGGRHVDRRRWIDGGAARGGQQGGHGGDAQRGCAEEEGGGGVRHGRCPGGGQDGEGAHHSCASLASIWSDVWMALEFIS